MSKNILSGHASFIMEWSIYSVYNIPLVSLIELKSNPVIYNRVHMKLLMEWKIINISWEIFVAQHSKQMGRDLFFYIKYKTALFISFSSFYRLLLFFYQLLLFLAAFEDAGFQVLEVVWSVFDKANMETITW